MTIKKKFNVLVVIFEMVKYHKVDYSSLNISNIYVKMKRAIKKLIKIVDVH